MLQMAHPRYNTFRNLKVFAMDELIDCFEAYTDNYKTSPDTSIHGKRHKSTSSGSNSWRFSDLLSSNAVMGKSPHEPQYPRAHEERQQQQQQHPAEEPHRHSLVPMKMFYNISRWLFHMPRGAPATPTPSIDAPRDE
jgi:hypothetical protein